MIDMLPQLLEFLFIEIVIQIVLRNFGLMTILHQSFKSHFLVKYGLNKFMNMLCQVLYLREYNRFKTIIFQIIFILLGNKALIIHIFISQEICAN